MACKKLLRKLHTHTHTHTHTHLDAHVALHNGLRLADQRDRLVGRYGLLNEARPAGSHAQPVSVSMAVSGCAGTCWAVFLGEGRGRDFPDHARPREYKHARNVERTGSTALHDPCDDAPAGVCASRERACTLSVVFVLVCQLL